MLVEGGRIEENLKRAERMVSKALQEKCQVIVLPECLDVGWTHPSAREFMGENAQQRKQIHKRIITLLDELTGR